MRSIFSPPELDIYFNPYIAVQTKGLWLSNMACPFVCACCKCKKKGLSANIVGWISKALPKRRYLHIYYGNLPAFLYSKSRTGCGFFPVLGARAFSTSPDY